MMKASGRKIIFYSLNPFISKNFITGITEMSFAGVRNIKREKRGFEGENIFLLIILSIILMN